MIQMLRFLAVSALTLSLLIFPAPASAGSEKHARALDTVERMLDAAHQAVASQADGQLPSAIAPYFAFDVWTRFLLQPRKKQFDRKHRKMVHNLLPGYIAHLYHDQFSKGLATRPTVGGTERARKDVLVGSRFPRMNGEPLPIAWRVRDFRDGRTQIIDIVIGGVSFMLLKRDEFKGIVDQGGPDGLLNYLRRNSG